MSDVPSPSSSDDRTPPVVVHTGVACDLCQESSGSSDEIVGTRFACNDCECFDLCERHFDEVSETNSHFEGSHSFSRCEETVPNLISYDLVQGIVSEDEDAEAGFSPEDLQRLNEVKGIYCAVLPKMPSDYVEKLISDPDHVSYVGSLKENVICATTFRPFREHGFVELEFVAVNAKFQVIGIGTKLMEIVKAWCLENEIPRILAYADDDATGYFERQGFSNTVTLESDIYASLIRHYDGSALMECVVGD